MYTTVENSSPHFNAEDEPCTARQVLSSHGGMMGRLHIKNKRWSEERDRGICRLGGGFLGVAASACEDSSAKNTQRFLLSSEGVLGGGLP